MRLNTAGRPEIMRNTRMSGRQKAADGGNEAPNMAPKAECHDSEV